MAQSAFSADRKERAARYNDDIKQYLADYYEVSQCYVKEFDTSLGGRYDSKDAERGLQFLDFCGIDWVVDDGEKKIGIAQRVRGPDSGTDMSVKVANGQGRPAEWEQIYNGWKDGGIYPNAYVHGVEDGTQLRQFVLVDVDRLCTAIKNREIYADGPYPAGNGHGVKLKFFRIESLRRNDCVLTEWNKDDDD